jgi:pyrimidine-nucleoside phosphorylase
MRVPELIRKTRDGEGLSGAEIRFMVAGALDGTVTEAQVGAWLMAITLRGMGEPETYALTEAFLDSGRRLDLSDLPGTPVDKHSTGGVGDKTSLVVVPLVAAAGVPVLKLSGRGLGFSGGTIDKLEAIPGFRSELPEAALRRQVREVGCVIAAPSAELAPADKRIYAIRDTTATVESLPLIAASIMSKKLAGGAPAMLFDVKVGRGAFMQEPAAAHALAALLIAIARRAGKACTALITAMDQPLGRAVGNALEVAEAVQCLRGEGPEDLTELCLAVSAEMVLLGRKAGSTTEARAILEERLRSGHGLETFARMIAAQGGDARVMDDVTLLPRAPVQVPVAATVDGFVARIDAHEVGETAVSLGAGRVRPGEPIDPAVGVYWHRKTGDPVRAGIVMAEVHARDAAAGQEAAIAIARTVTVTPDRPPIPPLIQERLPGANPERGGR